MGFPILYFVEKQMENPRDLTTVAIYTICDDLLISIGHRKHWQSEMSDAEFMTTALVAARYFGGNQQTPCAILKTLGYLPNILGHAWFNRHLHQIPQRFQVVFEYLAESTFVSHCSKYQAVLWIKVAACGVFYPKLLPNKLYTLERSFQALSHAAGVPNSEKKNTDLWKINALMTVIAQTLVSNIFPYNYDLC